RLSETVYTADYDTLRDTAWKETKSFRASKDESLIPMQFPGPLDTWAGGEQKEIVMPVTMIGRATLTINFLDSHESAPPMISITVGEDEIGRFRVSRGSGKGGKHWRETGIRSQISVAIPPGRHGADDTLIVIKTLEGSWAAIQDVTLERQVPHWLANAVFAGIAILALLWAWWITSRKLWKQYVVNTVLILGSVLVTLFVLELALRNFFPQQEFISSFRPVYIADDEVGFILKPNVKAKLGKDTNRLGMRDYDRYSVKKPKGVFRILVLGDSFTYSLTSMENSYPKYLERMLSGGDVPIEVMNSGVPNYGTDEEYHYLKKYGLRLQPDLVLLAFYVGNDITDNYIHPGYTAVDGVLVSREKASKMTKKEVSWEKRKNLILNKFHLYRLLYLRNYSKFFEKLDREGVQTRKRIDIKRGACITHLNGSVKMDQSKYSGIMLDAWKNTKDYIARVAELTKQSGAKLAIVIIPDAIQQDTKEAIKLRGLYDGKYEWDQPQRSLMEYGKELGVDMYDPLADMMKKSNMERLFYCKDTHFNEKGNRIFAETVAQWIVEKGMLPPGSRISR
ncbi:hypothetical protein MNBD_NITROSPINAE02-141, partial [hydrothermal vent metagenome]